MYIAGLEDAQLIFNLSYICLLCFPMNHIYPAKFTDKCMEKLEKLTERVLNAPIADLNVDYNYSFCFFFIYFNFEFPVEFK